MWDSFCKIAMTLLVAGIVVAKVSHSLLAIVPAIIAIWGCWHVAGRFDAIDRPRRRR